MTIRESMCGRKSLLFPVISVGLCYVLLQYMHSQVAHEYFRQIGVSPLLWSLFDVTCFLLVGYLLSGIGKWRRWCYSIMFVLVLVVSFVNVVYSRYFGQYLPLNMIGNGGGNLSIGAYLAYIHDSLSSGDAVYLVSILLFATSLWYDSKKGVASNRVRWYYGLSCFAVGASFQFLSLFNLIGHPHIPTDRDFKTNKFIPSQSMILGGAVSTIYKYGIVRGQVLYFFQNLIHDNELSEQQRDEIADYLNDVSKLKPETPEYATDKKNVVFLLCETYLSVTSDLVLPDGLRVTPFLDSLRHSDDTFYNGNMQPNVQLCSSADGQFIYMTGLLPLSDELALPYLWGRKAPTWCRALKARDKYTVAMTIPTDNTIWGQGKMSGPYGIDLLYATKETKSHGNWLNDEQVFDKVIREEASLPQPFVHFILTCTNHSPYESAKPETTRCSCRPQNFPQNYTKEFINYLLDCHYMDHQIKRYFSYLKESGLYDNSLIIIVSDHGIIQDQYIKKHEALYGWNRLPLYICNSGGKWVKDAKLSEMRINQIDLYPTILDLMGINQQYRGLGCSIFSPGYRDCATDEAGNVSAEIIRGHYFE